MSGFVQWLILYLFGSLVWCLELQNCTNGIENIENYGSTLYATCQNYLYKIDLNNIQTGTAAQKNLTAGELWAIA